jgi:predicted nucleic acid-binding protein
VSPGTREVVRSSATAPHGRLGLAYTPAILREYAEVLTRPEFSAAVTPAERTALLIKLRASGVLVTLVAVPDVGWPDPGDLPFVAAALATQRRMLVTLNSRDFAPAASLGVRVVSPSEARRTLR